MLWMKAFYHTNACNFCYVYQIINLMVYLGGLLVGFLCSIRYFYQCWCIEIMTSSNENIAALQDFCAGNSRVTVELPIQRPVTRSFDGFFDLRLNERLSKRWWGWWFEPPSGSLWRHCNVGAVKSAYCILCQFLVRLSEPSWVDFH